MHRALRKHLSQIAEDRAKKAARQIIKFALNTEQSLNKVIGTPHPRADILILPDQPDLLAVQGSRERTADTLARSNHRMLLEKIKELAQDCGLRIFEINPFGTSQVCSRCGSVGRCYSIQHNFSIHRPEVRFGLRGTHFACLCGYRANAEHNASVNLHHRFFGTRDGFSNWYEFQAKPKEERVKAYESIDRSLRLALHELYSLQPV